VSEKDFIGFTLSKLQEVGPVLPLLRRSGIFFDLSGNAWSLWGLPPSGKLFRPLQVTPGGIFSCGWGWRRLVFFFGLYLCGL